MKWSHVAFSEAASHPNKHRAHVPRPAPAQHPQVRSVQTLASLTLSLTAPSQAAPCHSVVSPQWRSCCDAVPTNRSPNSFLPPYGAIIVILPFHRHLYLRTGLWILGGRSRHDHDDCGSRPNRAVIGNRSKQLFPHRGSGNLTENQAGEHITRLVFASTSSKPWLTATPKYFFPTIPLSRRNSMAVPDNLKRRAAPFIRSCGSAPPVQKCGTNRTCLFSGGRPSGVLLQRRKFPYGAVLPNNICGTARPTPRCPQGFPSSAK